MYLIVPEIVTLRNAENIVRQRIVLMNAKANFVDSIVRVPHNLVPIRA